MAKNIKRYGQAYDLRQTGKPFREVGEIMGISGERARTLYAYYFFKKHKRFYMKTSNMTKR